MKMRPSTEGVKNTGQCSQKSLRPYLLPVPELSAAPQVIVALHRHHGAPLLWRHFSQTETPDDVEK